MYFMFSKLLYGFLKSHCLINYHLREISLTTSNWSRGRRKPAIRWRFLEHQGPLFPPSYQSLPVHVKFRYEDKEIKLSKNSEEIATFYAKLLNHELAQKNLFCRNFFEDWRAQMTMEERQLIKDFKKCDFTHIHRYLVEEKEAKKALSKEEKQELKELNEKILKKYAFCRADGRKEKIINFKIQPPGLFRGRGEHPKMGKLRKRIEPEDVIINCSADSKFPEPPNGHKWKEIRHDNKVEWLACWKCSLISKKQYTRLSSTSKLQIKNDLRKFQLARKLSKCIARIRKEYYSDLKSEDMKIRQRAVALYFIDKLALRAGNEKGEDQADTVGCCTLRVEHIQLYEEKDGQKNVVVFDFLGKDAIRYYNEVSVDELVFINLQSFYQNKHSSDKLFDKLYTQFLNRYLNKLMPGLTAKVFRTYNASITLQNQLETLTDENAPVSEKLLQYKRANRAVAILCNHQRTAPKSYEKSIENLNSKLSSKKQKMKDIRKLLESSKNIEATEKKLNKMKKKIKKLEEDIMKLKLKKIEKEETKTIAMETSKINYLDPRISVSWCKKHGVPIEEIYNKTQLSKFQWAIEKTSSDFKF